MPAKKAVKPRRKKATAGRFLATRPKMMTRTNRIKRSLGVDTRVFFFQDNGQFTWPEFTDPPAYHQTQQWSSQRIDVVAPHGWRSLAAMYDEYKVLGFTLKMYAVNLFNVPGVDRVRGNHITWLDQRVEDTMYQLPTEVGEVITNASSRMRNSRRVWTQSLWRPKGVPGWGQLRDITGHPDPWHGEIYLLAANCTMLAQGDQTNQPMYYWTVETKVIFRGRRNDSI